MVGMVEQAGEETANLDDELRVEWHLGGTTPPDTDPWNPAARALRAVLGEGQPNNRIICALFEPPSTPPQWFGVFVRSAGDRILFFPGFDEEYHQLDLAKSGQGPRHKRLEVDHFTLEADRGAWHITSPKSKKHEPAGRTRRLDDGRVSWFGVTLQSRALLRMIGDPVVVSFPVPSSDAERRRSLFRYATTGLRFPMLVPPQVPPVDPLLHFAVYVSPPKATDVPSYVPTPDGSPFFRRSLVRGIRAPGRVLRVDLDGIEIEIVVSGIMGSLSKSVVLTSD